MWICLGVEGEERRDVERGGRRAGRRMGKVFIVVRIITCEITCQWDTGAGTTVIITVQAPEGSWAGL